MKKKIVIIFIFVAIFSALVLSSCGEKSFTVNFQTNGGGSIAAVSVPKGEYLPLPQAPVREGFSFEGWYTDEGLTVPFDPSAEVRFDFTLYAKWEAITLPDEGEGTDEYSVWFDPQNGGDRTKITAEQGKSVVLPAEPVKSGFVFGGWYLDSEHTVRFTADYLVYNLPPSPAFTVYAKWNAADGEDGFTFILFNKTDPLTGFVTAEYAITSYYGSLEDVVTPESYKGTPVTMIGDGAFQGGTLRSVVISGGVASLGARAFFNCAGLEEVTLPDTLQTIGEQAFYNCVALREINPQACANLISIGNQAFYNCICLTELTISASVEEIGWKAFLTADDKAPSYLVIYAERVAPADGWDENWNSGNRPVVWNAGENSTASDGCIYFKDINLYALKGDEITIVKYNAGLSEYTLPEKVSFEGNNYPLAYIGKNAFYASGILVRINIGSSVKSIGAKAFSNCVNLSAVTFSADSVLTEIGASAFHNCENLSEINLPASLLTLGGYAFNDCKSLTALSLSRTVTTVGQLVFSGCTALTVTTDFAADGTPAGWGSKWFGNAKVAYGG